MTILFQNSFDVYAKKEYKIYRKFIAERLVSFNLIILTLFVLLTVMNHISSFK